MGESASSGSGLIGAIMPPGLVWLACTIAFVLGLAALAFRAFRGDAALERPLSLGRVLLWGGVSTCALWPLFDMWAGAESWSLMLLTGVATGVSECLSGDLRCSPGARDRFSVVAAVAMYNGILSAEPVRGVIISAASVTTSALLAQLMFQYWFGSFPSEHSRA